MSLGGGAEEAEEADEEEPEVEVLQLNVTLSLPLHFLSHRHRERQYYLIILQALSGTTSADWQVQVQTNGFGVTVTYNVIEDFLNPGLIDFATDRRGQRAYGPEHPVREAFA